MRTVRVLSLLIASATAQSSSITNLGTLPGGDFSVSTSSVTNLGTLPGGEIGCVTATVTSEATTCPSPTSTCILFCPRIPIVTTTATAVPWCPSTPTVTSYTCPPTTCYCPESEVITTTVSANCYYA